MVTVSWWTHKIGGLHRNDFIMAARSDQLLKYTSIDGAGLPGENGAGPHFYGLALALAGSSLYYPVIHRVS
ncbi:4a-hydroxytetrahydrobiopterin dehydratase [Aeromonas hydrophila]|uniref:4a-hydroxytetrahydrobiopterin dehydratase n=1 Tax=Aeromonas hydrophila TaxID=644 RepID=UPI003559362E